MIRGSRPQESARTGRMQKLGSKTLRFGVGCFKVVVGFRAKTGCAYGKKDKVAVAVTADALTGTRRDQNNIAGPDFDRLSVDIGTAASVENDVALGDSGQAVASGRGPRRNAGARDGTLGIVIAVGQL